MIEWIREHEPILWWLMASSVATIIASIIIVPWIIVRIPPDYFQKQKRGESLWDDQHAVVRSTLVIAKNVLGALFILAGIAMLLLPGQGVLTIIVGVMLMDFPGKFRFERWLISRRPILRSINWLRRRQNSEPLRI